MSARLASAMHRDASRYGVEHLAQDRESVHAECFEERQVGLVAAHQVVGRLDDAPQESAPPDRDPTRAERRSA